MSFFRAETRNPWSQAMYFQDGPLTNPVGGAILVGAKLHLGLPARFFLLLRAR
ncbi:MAG: hypothetical protein HY680_06090 [Chloroflexi bacterium]|nr:hypothetical protein [Chloroflexota bacterium]